MSGETGDVSMQQRQSTLVHAAANVFFLTFWFLVSSAGSAGVHAAVPAGKSALLNKIETGQSPAIFFVGSSLTRSSQSFWTTELQRTLRRIHGNEALGDVTECTGLGMTMYEMSKTGCINERVGEQKPDAISLETGWTDVKDELSIANMQSGLAAIIDDIRQDSPETEIFLYVPGIPSHDLWVEYRDSLIDAAERIQSVAQNKSVRVVWSRDAFLSVYDTLVAEGRVSEWERYIYDSHHPTLRAGVEFIIPAWLAALAGNESAREVYRPEMPRVCTKYRASLGIDKENGHMEVYSGAVALEEVQYWISVDGGTSFHAFTPDRYTASAFYWALPETIGGRSAFTIKARIKVRCPHSGAEFISEPFETSGKSGQPMPLALETLVGRHFDIGDSVRFDYVMDDNYVEGLEWEISFDAGKNWVPIDNQETWRPNRIFHWIAAESFKGYQTQSSQCIIRARDYNDDTYTDNTGLFSLGDASHVDFGFPCRDDWKVKAPAVGAWRVLSHGALCIPAGDWRSIDLFSIRGRRLLRWSGAGPTRLALPAGHARLFIRAETKRGGTSHGALVRANRER